MMSRPFRRLSCLCPKRMGSCDCAWTIASSIRRWFGIKSRLVCIQTNDHPELLVEASQQYSVHFYFCTFLFGHSGRQVHPVHVYSVHVYSVYFYSMHFYYVCVVFCVKPPLAKTLGLGFMLRFKVPSGCCLHHKVRRRLAYRETEFDALSERAEERRSSSAAYVEVRSAIKPLSAPQGSKKACLPGDGV